MKEREKRIRSERERVFERDEVGRNLETVPLICGEVPLICGEVPLFCGARSLAPSIEDEVNQHIHTSFIR